MAIRFDIDDPLLAAKISEALKLIAEFLSSGWPCKISVGYAMGLENPELPGELQYLNSIADKSYRLERCIGKLLGKLTGKNKSY